ncbi:SRPBCC family protein [Acinetobacter sp. ANC 5378]|uniref:SRPBCC family protein n=1 Tax=Acinetobacter sp. ANC 5378 TaxID=2731249 RepID=UPI00148F594A|nr:SRPBCC family protein [Acinetobacter sp. ANC 5378]NNG81709.1 SRPBCC family protein [Acinetobacter sp. ANC 5378]
MQNNKNKYSLLILCCLIGTQTSAKIIPWKEQIPSSLSLFQGKAQPLADLTANRILIYAHPAQSITLPTFKNPQSMTGKFYTGAVVVPSNSQNVARLLMNYSHYNGLFPTLKSAKVLEQQGNITQMKYQVHIPTPIPILNFKENVVMQHHLTANSISTLVLDAPIPYGVGKIEWFDLGSNKTLITITQWGDLNHPKGFLFSTILNAIPEAKLGIPSGTNAFLLEALQKYFKTPSYQTLKAGELPETPLSSIQVQKIATLSQLSQEPVSFILPSNKVPYPHDLESLRFTSSYQYFAKSPQQLQHWLSVPAYQELFPRQIKDIDIKKTTPNTFDADYKISVGLGVINIPFDFKLRFDYPNSLENQFDAVSGDLQFVRGGMQLIPQGNGTLLNITSTMKIHDKAPFLLRAMRSMPYHDMLPAIGGNTVLALKIKQKMK